KYRRPCCPAKNKSMYRTYVLSVTAWLMHTAWSAAICAKLVNIKRTCTIVGCTDQCIRSVIAFGYVAPWHRQGVAVNFTSHGKVPLKSSSSDPPLRSYYVTCNDPRMT
ncbi:hypothetical protein Smp_188900, partial [Schistosoma mansoni]|uniref:hypothetical protein n=1 Tax=Schistosoma mansoni TaxID=6183 RepID=UPI0001A62A7C